MESSILQAIPDEVRSFCKNCQKQFNPIVRGRHHCRNCGDIFCAYCTKYVAPSWVPHPIIPYKKIKWGKRSKEDKDKMRVCFTCFEGLEKINKDDLNILNRGFKMLTLDFYFFLRARWASAAWYTFAQMSLRSIRRLQFLPMYRELETHERQSFWNNRYVFCGHPHLMFQVTKSCPNQREAAQELVQLVTQPRRLLPCNRLRCNAALCGTGTLPLLNTYLSFLQSSISIREIRSYAIQGLSSLMDSRMALYFLPLLFQHLSSDMNAMAQSELKDLMFDMALRDPEFRFFLHWHLHLIEDAPTTSKPEFRQYTKQLSFQLNSFLSEKLGGEAVSPLNNSYLLCQAFEQRLIKEPKERGVTLSSEEIKHILADELSPYMQGGIPVTLITKPSSIIDTWLIDRVRVFGSATRPVAIPVLDDKGQQEVILFKPEDVRKDAVMIWCIRFFADIIEKKFPSFQCSVCPKGTPCRFYAKWERPITYNVLPVSINAGFIQIVQNAKTLADIEKSDHGLQNWLMAQNNDNLEEVRPIYIRSISFWTVVSFLLGLGDRHGHNLMLKPTGELFHIDFGFIMGEDPKPLMPAIRITEEMVDCIGGKGSERYNHFQQMSTQIYLELRKCFYLASQLLSVLLTFDPPLIDTPTNLYGHLEQRFQPGVDVEVAKSSFEAVLETSWNSRAHSINDSLRGLRS